ncbi:amidohydrolase family protein [Candidatus Bathyarchaeota archaeon]|nr:amidohydrolase family protein [Candidatus Bathyarchaeota archaeon]
MTIPDDLCADLAFINGKVITLNDDNDVHEAVSVKGGKILRVGKNAFIQETVGNRTKIINLDGKTLLPGLIDSHMHPGGSWGAYLVRGVACGTDFESVEEMLQAVAEKVDETPEGNWILGYRMDDVKMGRYPTLDELDEVAPDNPLYIQRRDGHNGVANSLALEKAGITKDTPDPHHGKIEHDEKGELTGLLRESAKDLVYHKMPPYSFEEFYKGLEMVFDECLKLGLTSIHASMVSPIEFKAMQALKRDGKLKIRVAVHLSGRDEGMVEGAIAAGIETPFGDEWLKITEAEWVFDTSTSGRTAAYYESYVGEPDNTGILLYDQDDITERVWQAHKAGIRVGLDGVGDRGIDRSLDAIEDALKRQPRDDHRHRIEHCCYVTPPIQERLLELGVIDASATAFLHDLGDAYKQNRGEEAMKYMWPHRSLIDKGIPAPGHSDASICDPNPWLGIYSMVTRKTSSGQVLYSPEGVTPTEAIKAYSIDGAYAAWEEEIKGTIESGKLADLVVVDRDPLTIDHDDLNKVETLMTVVDGKLVFER